MMMQSTASVLRASQPNARFTPLDALLARLGDALLRGRHVIQAVQWVVVGVYLVLISVPSLLPLPAMPELRPFR